MRFNLKVNYSLCLLINYSKASNNNIQEILNINGTVTYLNIKLIKSNI